MTQNQTTIHKQFLGETLEGEVWATWDDSLPVDDRTYHLVDVSGNPVDAEPLNVSLIDSLYHLIIEHETAEIFQEEF